jgi:NhaA family Na+:H+ antiporter
MPVFAFCNAGVMISADALSSSVVVAVAAGLLVGKPLGIVGATLLVAKLKLAEIPNTLNLRAIIGGGFLAGIGFTMALFIATLALDSAHLEQAKVGVLLGSFISAVIGMTILSGLPKKRRDQ